MSRPSLTRRQVFKTLSAGAAALAFGDGDLRAAQTRSETMGNPKGPPRDRIKAFCIDFNWGPDGFAPPGMFAQASAKEHLKWYQDLGVNTIQTFCVNCCGCAWYKDSAVAPVQPGLKEDFLREITDLGHAAGMRVMGYFCIGANTHWGNVRPDLSHGTPSQIHIPFTTQYLDYLCRSIQDAVRKVPIDGFMTDWLFSPKPQWIDCEEKMYTELVGEKFPGKQAMDAARTADFQRRATERAWVRIREATKSVRRDCIIWLSCYNLREPQIVGSRLFKEVDWLMNEHPDTAALDATRKEIGPHTRLIQCICGWGDQHDAAKVLNDPRYADVGMYGFAKADPKTTLPPGGTTGNAKNIEAMRKAFRQG
jgi:uncharacterized lipoprotein YddW (UPF0748 family)